MREFRERRNLRRVFFSKFTLILLAVILIFLVYSSVKVYLKSREAAQVNAMLQKEVDDLRAQKAELEASVNKLQTKTGAEEAVRDKFMVQKPGEKTVIIVDEGNKKENLPANVPSGFFPKIWQFIKNIF